MRLIDAYKRYKNSYENYLSVMIKIAMKKNVISVKLKDGTLRNWVSECIFFYARFNHSNEERLLSTFDDYSNSKLSESPIELRYNERRIRLFPNSFGGDFGAFFEIFVENTYKELLPLEGETVLDIGANIGDSSIYFALNNAEKVIALEPFHKTYYSALKNIEDNNLTNKITLLNAGYGKDSEILLDDTIPQDGLSLLKSSDKGVKVKIYSLETLLNQYNIDKAILKMDCEGCEYKMLNEDISTLRKFKKIQMEFHYGFKALERKLNDAGFLVKVFDIHKPGLRVDPELKKMALKNSDYWEGYIFATLK